MSKTYFKAIVAERNLLKKQINNDFANLIVQTKASIGTTQKICKILNTMLVRENEPFSLDGPTSLIPMIAIRNQNNLIATLTIIKMHMINQSYSLIRGVFEGIQKNYLLSLNNNKSKIIFNNDMGRSNKYIKFSEIRKTLYNGNYLKSVTNMYSHLSNASHPSAKGINIDNIYSKKMTKDVLECITLFSYFNGLSICEIYWNNFSDNEQKKLIKLLSSFGTSYKQQTISPNNVNILDIYALLN